MIGMDSVQQGMSWVTDHRKQLFWLLGTILAIVFAFEAGMIRGAIRQADPIMVSLPAVPTEPVEKPAASQANDRQRAVAATSEPDEKCVYVGSRNSNRYHLPKCGAAKLIKAENVVCFSSEDEARTRGYVAGCVK